MKQVSFYITITVLSTNFIKRGDGDWGETSKLIEPSRFGWLSLVERRKTPCTPYRLLELETHDATSSSSWKIRLSAFVQTSEVKQGVVLSDSLTQSTI